MAVGVQRSRQVGAAYIKKGAGWWVYSGGAGARFCGRLSALSSNAGRSISSD